MRERRPPRGFVRALYRAPLKLYRMRLGWLLGRRFLLLTHTGRRSGQARHTFLEVMRYDAPTDRYVVAVGFGERSDWYRNVLASPQVTIQVGTQERRAHARPLDREDARREFSDYLRRHP